MGIAPWMRRLREHVGHELLLVPAVAMLVWDREGRLLLVRDIGTGLLQTIGGAIEPDESPLQAGVREAREEAGIEVRATGLRAAVGGPGYRITYPNEDRVAYVSIVYDAHHIGGEPRPDDEETSEIAWVAPAQLNPAELTPFTTVLLREVGVMRPALAGPVAATLTDERSDSLLDRVADIWALATATRDGAGEPATTAETRPLIDEALAGEGSLLFTASTATGDALGFALVEASETDELASLRFIAVDPAAWGAGLAGRLLDALPEPLREFGYRSVELTVYDYNSAAIAAYERAGWQRTGAREHPRTGLEMLVFGLEL